MIKPGDAVVMKARPLTGRGVAERCRNGRWKIRLDDGRSLWQEETAIMIRGSVTGPRSGGGER